MTTFEPILAPAQIDASDRNSPDELTDHGFCILRDILPAWRIEALHDDLREQFDLTPFCIGEFYGSRTKRFGGVLKRSAYAEDLVRHPMIMEIAEEVLGPWCDTIQLNLTQAIEIHPGELIQAPHRDRDMWRAGSKVECLINVMWPFTEYTADNGATLIWPDSHRSSSDYAANFSKAVPAEMSPGSALVWLGSTLHGGGANRTSRPRSGLIVSYCLGWLRTFENQFLAYPPHIARTFSPELAQLIGYQQHRPGLGNHEGRCPSELLADAPAPRHAPFVDALPDWQRDAVTQFKTVVAPHLRIGGNG